MNHPPINQEDVHDRSKSEAMVSMTFSRGFVLAIAVMLPWPVIALATDHFFLQSGEKDLPFMFMGGLSMILLLPILFVFDVTNDLFLQISGPLIWLLIAAVPSYLMTRQPRHRIKIFWILLVLSSVSFIQAAVAMLAILTVNV